MAEQIEKKIVTRFAPSPTGFMHIGGVRTALFAFLWARKNNGTFILRIEDTDKEREVAGSIEHIQESLKWIGLDWDYGPDKPGPYGSNIQSERIEIHHSYASKLVEKGLAYPDPYTKEQIDAFRAAAQAEKRPFLFRDHRPEKFAEWDGRQPLRFKVPEIKRYAWTDAVRGELEAGPEALDDFILIKGDGFPTYNFAHIVDDLEMGVTHVFRGDEFISSTPKFLSLYDALGVPYPVFASLPPILRDDRTKKLGKRDGAKDILEYREEGYFPEAMVNFLALIGWNPGTEQEIFSMKELIEAFSLERIQNAGGAFNEDKLNWLNKEYMKQQPLAKLRHDVSSMISASPRFIEKGWQLPDALLAALIPLIVERISIYSEVKDMVQNGELDWAFEDPGVAPEKLIWKDDGKDAARVHLKHVKEILSKLSGTEFDSDKIKEAIWPYADEQGRGSVLWPLRYALSGKEKSPDPFTLIAILGKETSVRRIEAALEKLS